jgi:Zn-finger protein
MKAATNTTKKCRGEEGMREMRGNGGDQEKERRGRASDCYNEAEKHTERDEERM